MKRLTKYVFLLLWFMCGSAVGGGWQQSTTITGYYIEGSAQGDRIYLSLTNNTFNPDGCNQPHLLRVYGNNQKGKQMLAAIISAKALKQSVTPQLLTTLTTQ